jgi:hypothetical protein
MLAFMAGSASKLHPASVVLTLLHSSQITNFLPQKKVAVCSQELVFAPIWGCAQMILGSQWLVSRTRVLGLQVQLRRVSKKGIEMAAQITTIDRRQHPRDGIIGKLEDIVYAALRKCPANVAEPNREAKSA